MGEPGEDSEHILEALDFNDDTDVEMLEADLYDEDDLPSMPPEEPEATEKGCRTEPASWRDNPLGGEGAGKKRKRRKKNRSRKNKNVGSPPDYSLTDINRFVVDTCRILKEKKSYLVWNAIGCLGLAAICDLVKEVNAIQACGGQQTADGTRFRNGGGILWNILKTRDPKAYKEIMAKGKEFEKQFRPQKVRKLCEDDEKHIPIGNVNKDKTDQQTDVQKNEAKVHPDPDSTKELRSALERLRAPVAYDDLFEEGEIV